MKMLLFFTLLLLAFCAPAHATFTLVQTAHGTASSSATVSITLAQNIGSGHLIAMSGVAMNGTAGNFSSTSNSIGGTLTVDTNCHASSGTSFGVVACAYNLSSTSSGTTTLTVTMTGSNNWLVTFYEYSFTGAAVSYDSSGNTGLLASANPQTGKTITVTGTNDVFVRQIQLGGNGLNSVNLSYGHLVTNHNSTWSGTTDLENSTTGTGPSYTLAGSSNALESVIAFSEASAGGTVTMVPQIL